MYPRPAWISAVIVISVLLLMALSQRYWFLQAWRAARRIGRPIPRYLLCGATLAVFGLLIAGLFLDFPIGLHRIMWRNSRATALAGLWFSSALFAYLAVCAVAAIEYVWRTAMRVVGRDKRHTPLARSMDREDQADQTRHPERLNLGRRRFVQTATAVAGSIPFVGAAYGFAFERLQFQVRQIELPISDLPAALEGLRIAQLSDIHIGSYMSAAEVRRAVEMANDLHSDLTLVTGDFITGPNDPLEACIAELSRLRAPLGVWGCNGNHEIYAGVEAQAAKLFRHYGMFLLRQENVELVWRSQPFNLIGVDYQRERNVEGLRIPMLTAIETKVRRNVPNILMSHNPNTFPRAAELGVELMLTGHTHGGQVHVEILDHDFSPARFLTPYIAGAYRRPLGAAAHLADEEAWDSAPGSKACVVYVNRGLGTIGAPVRLGVPPEISLHTLRRA